MRVLQLWRHPLKSAGGERLVSAEAGAAGLVGDRRWALAEAGGGAEAGNGAGEGAEAGNGTGELVTARRDPVLLACAASLVDDGLSVVLPDGSVVTDGPDADAAFSALLGRPVHLLDSAPGPGLPDDPAEAGMSLVSTGSLGPWDPRRFRSNVVLDGSGEDGLVGSDVVLGTARLAVRARIVRCVMVTRQQPGLPRDRTVLRAVHSDHDGRLAVGATVLEPGVVAVGDDLVPVGGLSRRAGRRA